MAQTLVHSKERVLVLFQKENGSFKFNAKDVEPAGILFLDSTSTIEYNRSVSFLQETYCLKLQVATSCSLENKKCFTDREYILSSQSEAEALDWKSSISKAIQSPILKNTEVNLKGDSPKRVTSEMSNMVISQPVLISKKTFAMSKSAASQFTHRRNSVSDDLSASKSMPFVTDIPASYNPISCRSMDYLSHSNTSCISNLTRNTSDSSRHEKSFSSRFRSSMSGMLLNENQEGKYSLNILICKSIADSIRSFLGIITKIESRIEKANTESDVEGFLEFLSEERTLEYFALMFNHCEQIQEELHDIETEIINPGSYHNLDSSSNELISSVGAFISSMKNSCNVETTDKDCFVKLHLEVENINDCCRQILTSVSEIVKHQVLKISRTDSTSINESQQSFDTIPATPISSNDEVL